MNLCSPKAFSAAEAAYLHNHTMVVEHSVKILHIHKALKLINYTQYDPHFLYTTYLWNFFFVCITMYFSTLHIFYTPTLTILCVAFMIV